MPSVRRFATSLICTLLFPLLIIPLLAACRPVDAVPDPGTPSPTERHPQLVILHTNDTWGYYDPCG
jgi:hypothetical protein